MTEEDDQRTLQGPGLNPFQFRISQVLLWTGAVAAIAACFKHYPIAFFIMIEGI
jgi:hypothetical protein